ncbi:hypothetical protein A2264_01910 [candidate division WWE3 bacterium RIFOXYA2_FULL_46_9]|uniref:Uncharacterized protein n=1 Tax=candidate division WWE3 bacterium RIFOXYA2_FULL_46_9 TaxID=1802636 RepID=A0A1F4W0Q8_UNCKA|nr:MAG: hypothetical protein A2264_01910 [candidate division WWE3 bacterium RIFOXYA2_FULL_46_9]
MIFVVGLLATGGRHKEVLCSRRCKIDNVEHEVTLSDILQHWGYESRRGKDVDRKLLPDATILDGLHIELDMGSEDYSRVETRLRGYLDCDDPVIVITTTDGRKREILKRCDFLGEALRACTIAEAMADEVILEDCAGVKYILRKALEKAKHVPGVGRHNVPTRNDLDQARAQD